MLMPWYATLCCIQRRRHRHFNSKDFAFVRMCLKWLCISTELRESFFKLAKDAQKEYSESVCLSYPFALTSAYYSAGQSAFQRLLRLLPLSSSLRIPAKMVCPGMSSRNHIEKAKTSSRSDLFPPLLGLGSRTPPPLPDEKENDFRKCSSLI